MRLLAVLQSDNDFKIDNNIAIIQKYNQKSTKIWLKVSIFDNPEFQTANKHENLKTLTTGIVFVLCHKGFKSQFLKLGFETLKLIKDYEISSLYRV